MLTAIKQRQNEQLHQKIKQLNNLSHTISIEELLNFAHFTATAKRSRSIGTSGLEWN